MIPRKIHFCWFGGKEKPLTVVQYIQTWKKFFPDYEVIEWNESKFDINSCVYTSQAYKMGKYAFVSDYVRLVALYEEGGIYFDTDIEVVKDIGPLLDESNMLLGFEDNQYIMTGFMAARSGLECFADLIKIYNQKMFILENGKLDMTPNPIVVTDVMKQYGLQTNGERQSFGEAYTVFPVEYFSAYNIAYQKLEVSDKTYLIWINSFFNKPITKSCFKVFDCFYFSVRKYYICIFHC